MNNYDKTKHKIRTIWNIVEDINNQYNELKKNPKKSITILNCLKGINEYEVFNQTFSGIKYPGYQPTFNFSFVSQLNNFSEQMLCNIKIIPILTTLEGHQNWLNDELFDIKTSWISHNFYAMQKEETTDYEYYLVGSGSIIPDLTNKDEYQVNLKIDVIIEPFGEYNESRESKK
jgi:hypothetical protein